jgi:hypothetical protein
MDKQFLDSYSGQTTAELIALKDGYRIDSLVVAFEQAVDQKPETDLSESERFILAVEAMEREVNNGGWDQFFLNTNNQFDSILVTALETIGCPDAAAIAREAILSSDQSTELDDCDTRYFANSEPIAERLFDYIQNHQVEIKLP